MVLTFAICPLAYMFKAIKLVDIVGFGKIVS